MANSIGTLNAKVTANASGFSAAMIKAQKDADKLMESLRDQRMQLEMGDADYERYKMRLAGISDETIRAIDAERKQIDALKAQQQAMVTLTAVQGTVASGSNRATFAIQQLAFGAQDAASVFGTAGFGGAVRAASNNVIQFASLLSPLAGTLTAIGGTALAIWVDGMGKASDKQSAFNQIIDAHEQRLRKLIETIREAGKIQAEWTKIKQADNAGEGTTNRESLEKDIARLKAEQEQLDAVKAKFKEMADARKTNLDELKREDERRAAELQNPRLGAGKELQIFEVIFGRPTDANRKLMEKEAEKEKEFHQKIIEDQERIQKELQTKTAMLEESARKEKELKDLEAADKAAKAAEKEADAKIKEMERAAKESERIEQEQDRFRDKIDREGARRGEKIAVRAAQELKELDKLGFDARDQQALQAQIFANAEKDLQDLAMSGMKNRSEANLAGASELGSREAFGRAAEAFAGKSAQTIDDKLAEQIVVAREALVQLREIRAKQGPEIKQVAF